MPEEKIANPFPYPTPEEIAAAPGGREIKAARNIAVRKFDGIPMRAFLLGGNDHSPMMQGVAEFAGAVYGLLDLIDSVPGPLDVDGSGPLDEAAKRVRTMMDEHKCPTSRES